MTRTLFRFAAVLTAAATLAPARAEAQPVERLTFNEYQSPVTRDPAYLATFDDPLVSGSFAFYDVSTTSGKTNGNNIGAGLSAQTLSSWGTADLGAINRPVNLGSSNTMFGSGTTDRIEMYVNSAGPSRFRMYSVDMASLFARSSIAPALGAPAAMNIYFEYFKTFGAFNSGIPDGALVGRVNLGPTVNNDVLPQLYTIDFRGGAGSNVTTWLLGTPGDLTDDQGVYGVHWYQGSLTGWSNINNWTLGQRSGLAHQFTNITAQVIPEPSTFALAAVGLATVVGAGLRRRRSAA